MSILKALRATAIVLMLGAAGWAAPSASAVARPGGLLAPAATAATHSGKGNSFVYSAVTQSQASVLSYWTPRRIAGVDSDPAAPPARRPAPPTPFASQWNGKGAVTKTVGRLFFTEAEQGGAPATDLSCTATVVHSANRSVIVTAAHCVRSSEASGSAGAWAKNIMFVPGYRSGRAPYGRWTAQELLVPAAYDRHPAELKTTPMDTAFIVLNPDSRGRPIASVTGAQKIGFGNPDGTLYEFGYPRYSNAPGWKGQPAFIGDRLAVSHGTPVSFGGLPGVRGIPSAQSGGASGGPGFVNFDPRTGRGTVVAVNSLETLYNPADDSTSPPTAKVVYLFGTRFDNGVDQQMYARAQRPPQAVTVFKGVRGAAKQRVTARWTTAAMEGIVEAGPPVPGTSSIGDPNGGEWPTGTAVDTTVGRLFSSFGGRDHSCTATVVDALGGHGVIATAAHCVSHQGGAGRMVPQRNFYFVPGYRDGTAPYGGFTVRRVAVASAWLDLSLPVTLAIGDDQAFLALNRDAAGRTIEEATGTSGQRIAYQASRPGKTSYEFGYPVEGAPSRYEGTPAFTGNRVAACKGTVKVLQESGDGALSGIACGQGPGISGGPRFVDFDPATGRGTLAGIVNVGAPYWPGGCKSERCATQGDFGPTFSETVTGPILEAAVDPR